MTIKPLGHEDDIVALCERLETDDMRDADPATAAATIRSLCKQLDAARGVAPSQARPTFEPGEVQELARQGDLESFAEDVKQLCEDFSSRDGNVYIKDVQASIDALLARYVPGNAGVDVPGEGKKE